MLIAHFTQAARLLAGLYRLRKASKAFRKAEAHAWVQQRVADSQLGIIRARLTKMQRSDSIELPFTVPVASLDDEALVFYGALLINDGEYPYPPLDSISDK